MGMCICGTAILLCIGILSEKTLRGACFQSYRGGTWNSCGSSYPRVLNGDFKKVYTLKDISKWVEYGLKNNMISRGNKKEDVDNIMKWIDLLGRKHIQI